MKPAAALALVATAALLGGCQGDDELAVAPSATSPTAPVLQPGRPGEPNTSLTGTAALPRPTGSADPDDVTFMQDMIVHHAQAIAMVQIARDHLTDTQVKSLASRVADEQKPEIGAMARWLEARKLEVPPQAKNPLFQATSPHHGMKGMATREQLQQLSEARGVEADRLWLQLMTAHHRGAIEMVVAQHASGTDDTVGLLGDEIVVTQQTQINHMAEMLDRLS